MQKGLANDHSSLLGSRIGKTVEFAFVAQRHTLQLRFQIKERSLFFLSRRSLSLVPTHFVGVASQRVGPLLEHFR